VTKKKKLDNVVQDIYDTVAILGRGEPLEVTEEQLDQYAEFMKEALKDWLTPRANKKPTLRMSNVGKPSRQLWYDLKSDREPVGIKPETMIKFLYGHILERVVLFLTELAGHEVTDEQKEVKVSGVLGHMDCKIDGEVVDIKSASGYAFQKFKNGTLADDDPFGYMSQIAGYEHSEGTDQGGFLAINKENGELALFRPQELDKPNIKAKIKKIKSQLKAETPPDRCYTPIPDGASGNMKLPRMCTYCPHKFECHKDANDGKGLRVFEYSKGLNYLTKIVREPKVNEITHKMVK
jgi:hypothetical protein